MSCLTCSKTMTALGCKVTDGTFFVCPVCGTVKTCTGEVVVPDLVRRCRELHAAAFAFSSVLGMRGQIQLSALWAAAGLDEAIRSEDERAATARYGGAPAPSEDAHNEEDR